MSKPKRSPRERGASEEVADACGADGVEAGEALAVLAALGLAALPIAIGGDAIPRSLVEPGLVFEMLTPRASRLLALTTWVPSAALVALAIVCGIRGRSGVVGALFLAFCTSVSGVIFTGFSGGRVRVLPDLAPGHLFVVHKAWQSQARVALVEPVDGTALRRRYRVLRGAVVGFDETSTQAALRLLREPEGGPGLAPGGEDPRRGVEPRP